MTIDVSRKTFDPRRNTTWTTTLQGRVTTDAPQNEDRRIRDRRSRAAVVDLIGRRGYPHDLLPDSFKIGVSELTGELFIGQGRYYVDGHLAENFGSNKDGAQSFDDVLSEMRSSEAVPFAQQPYLPQLPEDQEADLVPKNGHHLVYLDVWQRDLSSLSDPSILDPAIPVDVFARRQTVWQVKTFGPVPEEFACNTPAQDLADWASAISPSGARLTTRGAPQSEESNPCLTPPGARYRGVDNRTYGLVIHEIKEDGTPLVKFSRVNGVAATRVLASPTPKTLRVVETGRDDFLRFGAGDWVEITDDRRELLGLPGVLARVDKLDEYSNTITLETALPDGLLDKVDPSIDPLQEEVEQTFHPIVRRWDQRGRVRKADGGALVVDLDAPDATGLIPMPLNGEFVALEDGVEVSLIVQPDSGPARIGDRWTFVSRYADGSVQELKESPPEDYHHHYARLAVVEAKDGKFTSVVSDCRDRFDLGGCCTAIVWPGQSIQDAINRLPEGFGGCVCLKPGRHTIDSALIIATANVTLHGESAGVVLECTKPGPVLRIEETDRVSVQTISFEQGAGALEEGVLEVIGSNDVEVTGCGFRSVGESDSAGVLVNRSNDVTLENNDFRELAYGVSTMNGCERPSIIGNHLDLRRKGVPGLFAIACRDVYGAARIVGNRVEGVIFGISINDRPFGLGRNSSAHGSLVAENTVQLNQELEYVTEFQNVWWFGIDVAADNAGVHDNLVHVAYDGQVGLWISGVGTNAARNSIVAANQPNAAIGMVIGSLTEDGNATAHTHVFCNTVRQAGWMGIQVNEGAHALRLAENIIVGSSMGIVTLGGAHLAVVSNSISEGLPGGYAILLNNEEAARVTDNVIEGVEFGVVSAQGSDLRVAGNTIVESGTGIMTGKEKSPKVAANTILNARRGGIHLIDTESGAVVQENRISNSGWGVDPAVGIGAVSISGEWVVAANEILDAGVSSDGTLSAGAAFGIFGQGVSETRIESNVVRCTIEGRNGREDRALKLLDSQSEFSCHITGNRFVGCGVSALVEQEQTKFRHVLFSHNHCRHLGPLGTGSTYATVVLQASAGVVMGNQVEAEKGGPAFASFNLNNMVGTVVGNVTTNGFSFDPNFPAPAAQFNLQI